MNSLHLVYGSPKGRTRRDDQLTIGRDERRAVGIETQNRSCYCRGVQIPSMTFNLVYVSNRENGLGQENYFVHSKYSQRKSTGSPLFVESTGIFCVALFE